MPGLHPKRSGLPCPFIVGVIAERTADEAARILDRAAQDGADAFELNLSLLGDAGPAELAAVIARSRGPLYTSCRRRAFMEVYGVAPDDLPDWTDDERMRRQLAMVSIGSVAIDIELDAFDPDPAPPLGSAAAERFAATPGAPAELTWSSAAIDRQREVAAEARALGADVLFSCHTGRPQSVDGLLAIARAASDRGADLLKVVTPCQDRHDLSALFEATARLAAIGTMPFALIGAGRGGMVSRWIGGHVGSGWLIGRPSGTAHTFAGQPSITQLRALVRLLPAAVDRTDQMPAVPTSLAG